MTSTSACFQAHHTPAGADREQRHNGRSRPHRRQAEAETHAPDRSQQARQRGWPTASPTARRWRPRGPPGSGLARAGPSPNAGMAADGTRCRCSAGAAPRPGAVAHAPAARAACDAPGEPPRTPNGRGRNAPPSDPRADSATARPLRLVGRQVAEPVVDEAIEIEGAEQSLPRPADPPADRKPRIVQRGGPGAAKVDRQRHFRGEVARHQRRADPRVRQQHPRQRVDPGAIAVACAAKRRPRAGTAARPRSGCRRSAGSRSRSGPAP